MKRIEVLLYCLFVFVTIYSQSTNNYSAVNPALFLHQKDDIYINPPGKVENGKNIISPLPSQYPWESRLENAMPNVLKDNSGNLSIYISSFIAFAEKPPSKVGALVYTNNTTNLKNWIRPDAGLYWYNSAGSTADEKISSNHIPGYQPTNIVAVDIESLGIYDDTEVTIKPIKLIYLPQRESANIMLAGYEMEKSFNDKGILQGFSTMKMDRVEQQKKFTFKFINGDTHMNYLKQNGDYYYVSRLNAKRSYLKPGESLPLNPDIRKRYRRETITKIGPQLVTKNVDFDIALDMSTSQWEPYSMQPFRLPSFQKDIWWGLVTMFGTEGDVTVQHKQRTELAISNDGVHWRYLKPGIPFLDNGTDPSSDDYGCINIAKPVVGSKFSSDSTTLYYFYAASNVRHILGRNPGISLATGKYGKLAGLKAGSDVKVFNSMEPSKHGVTSANMPNFSISKAFHLEGEFYPHILGDITEDPRGKSLTQLSSYVAMTMFAYSPEAPGGIGDFLGGTLGSSKKGTNIISDNYEAIGFVKNGIDGMTKEHLLRYLKSYSDTHISEIISIKNFIEIPVVLQAYVKNATFYGIQFRNNSADDTFSLNITEGSKFKVNRVWEYIPTTPSTPCHTEDFSSIRKLPNEKTPVDRETGAIAMKVLPKQGSREQTVLRMYGDNNNNMGIYYTPAGSFQFRLMKDGLSFALMDIAPPTGKTFSGKEVVITLESTKKALRKHGIQFNEDANVFRVACSNIGFDKAVQQPILWNWKHVEGSITPADSANARGFAYLVFSGFIAQMSKISVGGSNAVCDFPFDGSIYQLQISEKLPSGSSDFWDVTTQKRKQGHEVSSAIEGKQQRRNFVFRPPNPVRKEEYLNVN